MPRVRSEKQYNTFVKGLITEANPLTYPENASLDEDNFVLRRNGSRERRLGIDYEVGYDLKDTGLSLTTVNTTRTSYHKWEHPGGDSSVSIGVIRVHNKLWFYNILLDPISDQILNGGNPIEIAGLSNARIDTAVVNNYFIIVSSDLALPIVLDYNKTTQLVTQTSMPIQVRDVWGVVDNLALNERPTTLTKTHEYNLLNQGWNRNVQTVCAGDVDTVTVVQENLSQYTLDQVLSGQTVPQYSETETISYTPIPAIQCTYTTLSLYPSNADIWSLGKVADTTKKTFAKYSPNNLIKFSVDNVKAPKGSLIIDAFLRGTSRRKLLGSNVLPLDKELNSFTTVAAFSGRVFYSGIESSITDGDAKSPNYSNYVFYSQIVDNASKLGLCYQEADPTSDRISDLVDSDGGTIQIPEATHIVKLVPTKSSLLVFAENGVWEIYGNDVKGFSATSQQVSKIGSSGCSSPDTIVEVYGTVLAWLKSGIFVFTQDNVNGRYQAQNISLATIQTFYNGLTDICKNNARGFYDDKENVVRWLFNDSENYIETSLVNKYNRELVLDLTLQAFYPQTIDTSLGPYIADYVDIPSYATTEFQNSVFVGTDEVFAGTDNVAISDITLVSRVAQFGFLTIVDNDFTFSKYQNSSFMDWQTYNGMGITYSSYLVTGHQIFGDILRHKQVPYVWFYFKRTEDGFSELDGYLQIDNPSSCLVKAKWNWTDSANSGQWGSQFQAYAFNRPYIPTGPQDNFDYGYEVIVTKRRLRGSGRSLSLLIESENGKDMKLLGWAMVVTGDSRPDGN